MLPSPLPCEPVRQNQFVRKTDMDLTCQDVNMLLLYLCYIELYIIQLFIASNDSRVIESIEALYVAIVFLNSLKFASRESRCLAASIPRGTLRYLQTVLYVTVNQRVTQLEQKSVRYYMYLQLYESHTCKTNLIKQYQ